MNAGSTALIPSAEATDAGIGASQPLINTDVNGGDSETSSPVATRTPTSSGAFGSVTSAKPSTNGSTVTAAPQFTPGYTRQLHRLCFTNEGVLYEDSQLQIGVKSEYHGNLGRIALYFGNKISVGFSSFTVQIKSQEPDKLGVVLPKMPANTLGAMTQVQQIVEVECKDVFTKLPVLKVSYLAGSMQELTLRLPVILSKFIEPVQLGQTDFFERWKQIGGAPREAQKVFGIKLQSNGQVDTARQRKVISGSRLQILDGIDPNAVNIVAAGVLHMSDGGKVGCLLRNEPNAPAKVSTAIFLAKRIKREGSISDENILQLCRLTIRTTNDVVSSELLRLMTTVMSSESQEV